MSREPVPTHFFALTVVHRDGRYLLVHERKHEGWYLPAGRVEPGESLAEAAVRETLEETGVEIVLEGVLRLEHASRPDGEARVRAFFLGRPAPGSEPRRTEDNLGAGYFTPEEIEGLPLRAREVLAAVRHHAEGGRVLPLDAIAGEGSPW